MKYFLNLHARELFFRVPVQSIVDYGSKLWESQALKPLVSQILLLFSIQREMWAPHMNSKQTNIQTNVTCMKDSQAKSTQ